MQSPNNSGEKSNMGKFLKLGTSTIYKCYFCPQTFPTKQALGGHQNAHREERKKFCCCTTKERTKLSKYSTFMGEGSVDTALSLSVLPPPQHLGSGPRGGFKPRHGIRFEPYLQAINQCNCRADSTGAWIFKDDLTSSLGESTSQSIVEYGNEPTLSSINPEKGRNYEDVNTDLSL